MASEQDQQEITESFREAGAIDGSDTQSDGQSEQEQTGDAAAAEERDREESRGAFEQVVEDVKRVGGPAEAAVETGSDIVDSATDAVTPGGEKGREDSAADSGREGTDQPEPESDPVRGASRAVKQDLSDDINDPIRLDDADRTDVARVRTKARALEKGMAVAQSARRGRARQRQKDKVVDKGAFDLPGEAGAFQDMLQREVQQTNDAAREELDAAVEQFRQNRRQVARENPGVANRRGLTAVLPAAPTPVTAAIGSGSATITGSATGGTGAAGGAATGGTTGASTATSLSASEVLKAGALATGGVAVNEATTREPEPVEEQSELPVSEEPGAREQEIDVTEQTTVRPEELGIPSEAFRERSEIAVDAGGAVVENGELQIPEDASKLVLRAGQAAKQKTEEEGDGEEEEEEEEEESDESDDEVVVEVPEEMIPEESVTIGEGVDSEVQQDVEDADQEVINRQQAGEGTMEDDIDPAETTADEEFGELEDEAQQREVAIDRELQSVSAGADRQVLTGGAEASGAVSLLDESREQSVEIEETGSRVQADAVTTGVDAAMTEAQTGDVVGQQTPDMVGEVMVPELAQPTAEINLTEQATEVTQPGGEFVTPEQAGFEAPEVTEVAPERQGRTQPTRLDMDLPDFDGESREKERYGLFLSEIQVNPVTTPEERIETLFGGDDL